MIDATTNVVAWQKQETILPIQKKVRMDGANSVTGECWILAVSKSGSEVQVTSLENWNNCPPLQLDVDGKPMIEVKRFWAKDWVAAKVVKEEWMEKREMLRYWKSVLVLMALAALAILGLGVLIGHHL